MICIILPGSPCFYPIIPAISGDPEPWEILAKGTVASKIRAACTELTGTGIKILAPLVYYPLAIPVETTLRSTKPLIF